MGNGSLGIPGLGVVMKVSKEAMHRLAKLIDAEFGDENPFVLFVCDEGDEVKFVSNATPSIAEEIVFCASGNIARNITDTAQRGGMEH